MYVYAYIIENTMFVCYSKLFEKKFVVYIFFQLKFLFI